jgi:intracellular sulfur oxidation DsrE/DsrF family protein
MTDAEAGAVIVVRHVALPMVFGDTIWKRLKLGAFAKIKDPLTSDDAERNPFTHVKAGEKTVLYDAGAAVDVLTQRGVIILACNMALMHFADMLAKAEQITIDEARSAIVATLLPGVILMPSGIFAVAHAQDVGCRYIRST